MALLVVLALLITAALSADGAVSKQDKERGFTVTEEEVKLDTPIVADLSIDQLMLIVKEPNWPVFVMFSKMNPSNAASAWTPFREAAHSLQGVVPFAYFNCKKKAHESTCKTYTSNSYPRYLLFPPGAGRHPLVYYYDLRSDLMLDFAIGNLDTYVAHVEPKELSPFLRAAAAFPRVVYLTDETWLDPRLNTMAYQRRLRTVIGSITQPPPSTLRHFNLTSSELPTAVAYHVGADGAYEKFGSRVTQDNWGEFGAWLGNYTLSEIRDTKVNPLEFHEKFSSARPVSKIERLNGTTFENEVFAMNGTRTLVLFYHKWMVSCRKLLSIYEHVPHLMQNDDIEVGALDLDDGNGNAARQMQTKFQVHALPAIVLFPGNNEDPFKMHTLDRSTLDKAVTAEEIVQWARTQDEFWQQHKIREADNKRREEELLRVENEERAKQGLPPKGSSAAKVILTLEDSDEAETAAEVEKHYTVEIQPDQTVHMGKRTDL